MEDWAQFVVMKYFLFEICVLVFRAFVLPVLDLITYFIKLGDPLEVYELNEIILLIKRTTAEFIFINLSIQHFIDGQGQVYQVPNYAKVIPRAFLGYRQNLFRFLYFPHRKINFPPFISFFNFLPPKEQMVLYSLPIKRGVVKNADISKFWTFKNTLKRA